MSTNNNSLQLAEKNISDSVLARVNQLTETGGLVLPKDYSAANAIRYAWLQLSQMTDREGKKILDKVTKESVSQALFQMVQQGLSTAKNQGYFIPYGNTLSFSRNRYGTEAIAKRIKPDLCTSANVIFEGDVFEYRIDTTTGKKVVTNHEQKFENIDINKIKGAYAVVDGELTVMTIAQIRQAWNQGRQKGQSDAHKNFTDEMCIKTVIGRALKTFVNSSDDAYLYDEENVPEPVKTEEQEAEVLDMNEAPIAQPEPVNEPVSEPVNEPVTVEEAVVVQETPKQNKKAPTSEKKVEEASPSSNDEMMLKF